MGVTYSLHLGQKYCTAEALACLPPPEHSDPSRTRVQRTIYALTSIGCSEMGSALITVGSAAFLLNCTLTIFDRLTVIVVAATVLSIVAGLVPLAAGLAAFGPRN